MVDVARRFDDGEFYHPAEVFQNFGSVTAFDVIEHFDSPSAFFESADRFVRPGGRLILTTPNKNSKWRRIYGEGWHGYGIPQYHRLILSERFLRDQLVLHGYIAERIVTVPPIESLRWRLLLASGYRLRVGRIRKIGALPRAAVKLLSGKCLGGEEDTIYAVARSGMRVKWMWPGRTRAPAPDLRRSLRGSALGSSRVLIYRLGSLGDTVVALPSFHLIERAFPGAERRVLTNLPVHSKAPAMREVLTGSGLVHSWYGYRVGARSPRSLFEIIRAIRTWKPGLAVYLAAPRAPWTVYRDLMFFRLCGVRRIWGAPLSEELRANQPVAGRGALEYVAERLARCLSEVGDSRLDDPSSWSLRFSSAERATASQIVNQRELRERGFLACSVGTKIEVKDWGEIRWGRLLAKLGQEFRGLGLVMAGSAGEATISERVGRGWCGPVVNLCGRLTPRETAAVLEHAVGFIGHDSGPMHLAAAVGVPCTAIFSARNIPRVGFPYGEHHRVIYHRTACAGCRLERCTEFGKQCIESITVEEVYENAAPQIAMSMSKASHSRHGGNLMHG
jgi:ADP-heptose:LPS heptosyltransferase